MITTAHVCSPVHESFRVAQIAGMFDLDPRQHCEQSFSIETPGLDEPWTIGVIVGPSGSGKSTIAAAAYGDAVHSPQPWPHDRAVIDGFGDAPLADLASTLTAVGLGSAPAWIKPHHVLSTGQRFRCDLARALLEDAPLLVFDEFTSNVDRTVAKVASAALAKGLRKGRWNKRFVAVSCHEDFLDWLAPDWVADLSDGQLHRRRLRRPEVRIQVARCRRDVWPAFARHHYLSGSLPAAAMCYLAWWDDRPVAFCAVVGLRGARGRRRISRLVTLPDFQGLGVGSRLLERVSQEQTRQGRRVNITTRHPAMVGYCLRSANWRTIAARVRRGAGGQYRRVASFEFIGDGS